MSHNKKIISLNKKASFDYIIEEQFESGIMLKGSELKSIRQGQVSIVDAYATYNSGELYLCNCYIAEYKQAHHFNHAARAARKLLLHKREINKIIGKIKLKGYSLVALSLFFNDKNIVKVNLGLAKGKKQYDKRQAIKEQDWQREQAQIMRKKQ